MPEVFPDFADPTSLEGGASWTAEFESYDQRSDCAYYFVTVRTGDDVKELWARVDPPSGQPFHDQLHRVAAAGETNTEYTGSLMWELKRKALAVRQARAEGAE